MTYYFQTKVWIRTLIWIHSSHPADLPGSNWIRNKLEYSREREGEDDCPVSAELPEGPLLILEKSISYSQVCQVREINSIPPRRLLFLRRNLGQNLQSF
jgi:hypothetical protein